MLKTRRRSQPWSSARVRFEQAATRLTLGFSLLVAGERLAHAEDVSAIENLLTESVVSSASKQSEKGSSAPALSSILTAEDLRKYGVRTVAEAIDFLSIAVSSSENLNGGEVGARGVLLTGDHGSHFLVLVDGNVINDPLRGGSSLGSRAGIPLELIDHIEIIVGPGSVLYGSNAMFGLLNIVTKRAKDYSGARVMVESALPISIRAGAGVGKEISVLGQEGEVTAQFEYFEQRGPDLFFGAENTGVDRFTGQPGRNTRTGGPTGLWGGRDAEHSLYVRGPSGVLRAALGNTELDLQGSYYHYGTPTGPGDFDSEALLRALRRATTGIRRCYEHALNDDPTLNGRVEIGLTVEESGSVTHVRATENTTGSDEVERCVIRSVSALGITPAPTGGSVSFSFPFVFATND